MKTPILTAGLRNCSGISRIFFATLLLTGLGGAGAFAQVEKAGTGTSGLGTSGVNWTSGTAPTNSQVALWDSVSTTGSQTLDAATSWGGIQLTSVSAPVLLGPGTGGTLTLGTSGIDTSTASSGLTISAPLTLVGTQSWTVGSSASVILGSTLTIGAAGNATASLVTIPEGSVSLSGAGVIDPDTSGTNAYALIVENAGTTFTTSAGFTVNGQSTSLGPTTGVFVESGATANFNSGLTLTESAGANSNFANVTVTGGTLNASSISVVRQGGNQANYGAGLIVSGGVVNVTGNYAVGNVSYTGSTVNGGTVNVDTGATAGQGMFVGYGVGTGGRGVTQYVSSGSIIVNSAATAIGITLNGGQTATASAALSINGTGNISTPILNFGNSTTTSGTASLVMTGGSLYIGSGGIVKNGSFSSYTFSGTNSIIGATAPFTTRRSA